MNRYIWHWKISKRRLKAIKKTQITDILHGSEMAKLYIVTLGSTGKRKTGALDRNHCGANQNLPIHKCPPLFFPEAFLPYTFSLHRIAGSAILNEKDRLQIFCNTLETSEDLSAG
jgi:hypothetical protein